MMHFIMTGSISFLQPFLPETKKTFGRHVFLTRLSKHRKLTLYPLDHGSQALKFAI